MRTVPAAALLLALLLPALAAPAAASGPADVLASAAWTIADLLEAHARTVVGGAVHDADDLADQVAAEAGRTSAQGGAALAVAANVLEAQGAATEAAVDHQLDAARLAGQAAFTCASLPADAAACWASVAHFLAES